ncbi:MAG: AEC family transporter [Oscillospiraceae bacterium]|nr:AEC family transporter [Oscillospiraceae bacterium]
MQMSALLSKLALFVIVMLIGMFGAKKKLLKADFNRGLTWLVINVFLVASIFTSVISMDASSLTAQEFGRIMLFQCGAYVLIYVISAIVVHILPVDKEKAPQLELLMSSVNTLFVTLPVVETVYGAKGAFIVALGCIPFNVILFTYGIARLRGSAEGGFRLRDILSTPLVATVAATLLFLLRVPVPSAVRGILSSISAATVPLSMLLVGSSLGNVQFKKAIRDKNMLFLIAERFLLAPIIMFFVMKLCGADEMLRNIMVITAATPSAILVTALSLQNGRDGEFPSEGILLTTVLSMITLPITFYLLLL